MNVLIDDFFEARLNVVLRTVHAAIRQRRFLPVAWGKSRDSSAQRFLDDYSGVGNLDDKNSSKTRMK